MRKLVVVLFVAGLFNVAAIDALRACGGGCGGMGGGRGRAYAGRTAASRKVLAGGPSAQAELQVARQVLAPTIAGRPANKVISNRAPVVRTVADQGRDSAKSAANPPLYSCPMHPQVQWTKPTECPICGMKLKLKRAKAGATTRGTQSSPEHEEMNADETALDLEWMDDMPGMGIRRSAGISEMQMCPGCMMHMDEVPSSANKQAPPASEKARGGGMRSAADMGCGC